jgi:hypothetical protein
VGRLTLQTVAVVTVAMVMGMYALPARADDASDTRAVISAQMQAFRQGNADAAYSFAAPGIRAIFPTPEGFLAMVMNGYAPVYQANDVTYGPIGTEGSGLRQEVFITDREGRSWIASYTLERQPDGSLKITSCAIRRGTDVST